MYTCLGVFDIEEIHENPNLEIGSQQKVVELVIDFEFVANESNIYES